jgi:hypothetical protein
MSPESRKPSTRDQGPWHFICTVNQLPIYISSGLGNNKEQHCYTVMATFHLGNSIKHASRIRHRSLQIFGGPLGAAQVSRLLQVSLRSCWYKQATTDHVGRDMSYINNAVSRFLQSSTVSIPLHLKVGIQSFKPFVQLLLRDQHSCA